MKATPRQSAPPARLDTTNCDREPIHIPGSIQPHGVLLMLANDATTILQASENLRDYFGVSAAEALGQPLSRLLGNKLATSLERRIARIPQQGRAVLLQTLVVEGPGGASRQMQAIGHRHNSGIFLELESANIDDEIIDVHAHVDAFTLAVEASHSIEDMSQLTSREIQRLTGFDRVLVYRFDPDWNGVVIGETVNDRFPSLYDHRFPASDIPAQARELYRINRVRIIPDSRYKPAAVLPGKDADTGEPLDLTFSVLRSVSPVHVEYMRNMKTASSMSISILRDEQLWGLISCHHSEPRTVPFAVRMTCDLFARAFSLRLSALEHTERYQRRVETRGAYGALLDAMSHPGDFLAALAQRERELLSLTNATGAALISGGRCLRVGDAPPQEFIEQLAEWLQKSVGEDVYATHSLPQACAAATEMKDVASGLLAVRISRLHADYVMWFRPEVLKTIRWGGNPTKGMETIGDSIQLQPRRSFETWKEIVREQSRPWTEAEIEGANDLQKAIVGVVLRKAEELAELNTELTRSNRELESFSYSVSHDLRAPLRHIVGYAEMLRESLGDRLVGTDARCIENIIESSEYAGRLVDKLLQYSRLGRADLQRTTIDMNVLLNEVRRDVMRDSDGRDIVWNVAPLPSVFADLMMLRMAVRDLASNAVKYTRNRKQAVIEIGSRPDGQADVFWVKDNGVGFDMQYSDKLFGVFQRLHRWEDYEGTGIGLANVRRVIERHGGCTWAEGIVDQGATFYFKLPRSLHKGGV